MKGRKCCHDFWKEIMLLKGMCPEILQIILGSLMLNVHGTGVFALLLMTFKKYKYLPYLNVKSSIFAILILVLVMKLKKKLIMFQKWAIFASLSLFPTIDSAIY